jgi:hypothetical protein
MWSAIVAALIRPFFQAHLAQLAANVADALRGSATSSSNKGDAIDSEP